MSNITGLELSSRKIDYLKYLFGKEGSIRTTQISNQLNVDPSTATKTLQELNAEGYVDHIPYRGVKLTDIGREYAEFSIRRHRILSLMLSHYGIKGEDACREVSRFESKISKDAIDRICKSMGHPTTSICGLISHKECENHSGKMY